MHLYFYLGDDGCRIYTLKKTNPSGSPTRSAHPARFSPDDKFSQQRYILKKRYNLLPTQQVVDPHSKRKADDHPLVSEKGESAKPERDTEDATHVFHTRFDGSITFKVQVHIAHNPPAKTVSVYQCQQEGEEPVFEAQPKLTVPRCQTIFIGNVPITEQTKHYAAFYNGNSILILRKPEQKEELNYIFVGERGFGFTAEAEISTYLSPVDGSVPCPYAIDVENNVYLMTETVMFNLKNANVANSLSAEDVRAGLVNPYRWFFSNQKITNPYNSHTPPGIQNFQGIDKFFIGKHVETLQWNAGDKRAEFRRHANSRPQASKGKPETIPKAPKEISIKMIDGTRRTLTEKSYEKLLQDFANVFGFRCLRDTQDILASPYAYNKYLK